MKRQHILSFDQTVAKRLTWQYIIALSIVALLSVFGQVLIQISLLESADNSHVINLAGRQRMLSQRLTKMTVLKALSTEVWDSASFSECLADWRRIHVGLRDNKLIDGKRFEVNNSEEIKSLFEEITPFYNTMVSIFEQVEKGEVPNQEMQINLLMNEEQFLAGMDKIVFEYDTKATKKVDRLRAFEFLILLLTLLTLFIEYIFILNPLARYVRKVILQFIRSEKRLQEANEQLSLSNKMLRKTQNDLERATIERYELKRKEDQTRTAALLEGQEEERKRMSQEIHDGLGQMLTGMKLALGRLKSPEMPEKFQKAYAHVNLLLQDTIESSRAISFNLMPTALNDFGIESALKILIQQSNIGSKTKFEVEVQNPGRRYGHKVEVALYRIAQEALNNILKYAKASKAKVSLLEKDGMLEFSITDNGTGFDVQELKRSRQSLIHNGLENMKSRVALLNGTFKLTTIKGEGTDIFIKLPLINED
ncbi:histidine kinase [Marinilongibacter aquaticus]|uniref:ATP-binding protein n=1 Tax=Marinilongibacter aquaticus TaxID=2975157 RepID=UPI0021BD2E28|nr:ATP-binding protein [Marinilongibacter aquaticus]UBM57349.1 histidine kinase [Marinilongibacter aquaticus]